MKFPTLSRICLALATMFLLNACDPDDQPTTPQGSSADVETLLPLSFYYIQDADGKKADPGVDIVLLFEPNGIADLYVARDQEAIAYKGSYSVKDGKIALKFNDADFKTDVSFTIDTAQNIATMPFAIFSPSATSSTWRRERKPLEHNLRIVFSAATLAENLETARAMQRTVNYANAVMEAGKRAQGFAKTSAAAPVITSIKPLENGVELRFNKGPAIEVQLFSWSAGDAMRLEMSPIASDPRVHLDPEPPHNGEADPIEKTALFIAPFDGDRHTVTWYDYAYLNRRATAPSQLVHLGLADRFQMSKMLPPLEQKGYRTKVLRDADASVANIIESLLPGKDGRSHSPGFVALMTHGLSNGHLYTGTILGDSANWRDVFADEMALLKSRGYADLLTYGGGTEENPATLSASVLFQDMRPGGKSAYAIVLTPKFWEWLRTRQADFSRSLVFVAACLTDATPDLHDAIKARAYFSFDISVNINVAAKILEYFCKSLARPTHSAEETYYNVLRTANTRQMIYAEDKILDANIQADRDQIGSVLTFFKGYGYDGTKMISYMEGGWLNTMNADPGAIWWLLFSGRWGQNAASGTDGMLNCWESFWKDGKTGGLANPACHNKTPGRAPTELEVAYASYLLSGRNVLSPQGMTRIPRWTLNDGR